MPRPHARRRIHDPAFAAFGDGGGARACDDLRIARFRLAREALQKEIGVNVPCVIRESGHGDRIAVQDRDDGARLIDRAAGHLHVADFGVEIILLVGLGHDHQAAGREDVLCRTEMVFGGEREFHHRRRAIARFIKRGGTARGVMGEGGFGLQHRDGAKFGQAGSGRDACDAAANDEEIGHASSKRSVAGGGAG